MTKLIFTPSALDVLLEVTDAAVPLPPPEVVVLDVTVGVLVTPLVFIKPPGLVEPEVEEVPILVLMTPPGFIDFSLSATAIHMVRPTYRRSARGRGNCCPSH